MASGIIVIDNSAFAFLESAEVQQKVLRDARTADWEIAISVINAIEAAKTSPPSVRDRLRTTIRALAPDGALWPWPQDLLKGVAQAFMNRDSSAKFTQSGLEWLIRHPTILDEQRSNAHEFAKRIEDQFNAMHGDARKDFQQGMREKEIVNEWTSATDFLVREWNRPDVIRHFAGVVWKALGYQGAAPVDHLLLHPVWRIFLDAEGFAVYARGIAKEMPRRVHRLDLLQLLYLGARERRIFVSADEPLLGAARAILDGRFGQSRVMHARDFVAV